jgi:thiol:disulfide interchange protein DsbD
MKTLRISFFSCLFTLLCLLPAFLTARAVELPPAASSAAGTPDTPDPLVTASQAFSVSINGPARRVAVITLTPAAGYHFYAREAGEAGKPVAIIALAGDEERPVLYPQGTPKPDTFDPSLTVNVHDGPARFYVPLPDDPAVQTLSWSVSALMCSAANCWPVSREGTTKLAGQLQRAEAQPWWGEYARLEQTSRTPSAVRRIDAGMAAVKQHPADGNEVRLSWNFTPRFFMESLEVRSMGKALLFGLIAGLILNFMPCVLPVVSLKLSTLLTASGIQDQNKRIHHFRMHNIWFSAGIMCFFLLLAAVLGLAGLAWGSAFQSQTLVAVLVVLVFTLGLSMFGVFNLPVLDLKAVPTEAQSSPRGQAFFTGMMATLLATPCSGPFLGGVLGWAFMQSPLVLGAVFASVGLGMSSPYLTMAVFPALVKHFPRPGSWIGILERLVGFFLMGTTVYLLRILPETLWPSMLVLLWITGLAAWVWGRFSGLEKSFRQRLCVRVLCAATVMAAAWWLNQPPAPHPGWERFEAARFEQMLGKQPVIVDFTADWCPNCKVLEHTTLHAENLRRWMKQYNARIVQVDLTEPSVQGESLLKSLGSSSIPVVALFPAGQHSDKPLVLRDIFTTEQMEEALQQAFGLPATE